MNKNNMFAWTLVGCLLAAAPWALEFVAQTPQNSGSANTAAATMAQDAKVTGLQAQVDAQNTLVKALEEKIAGMEDCGKKTPPQVWNGAECVSVGGSGGGGGSGVTVPPCPAGEVLTGRPNGVLLCVPGGTSTSTNDVVRFGDIPNCQSDEALTYNNNKFACIKVQMAANAPAPRSCHDICASVGMSYPVRPCPPNHGQWGDVHGGCLCFGGCNSYGDN